MTQQPMSRKEALAVMHHLFDAYIEAALAHYHEEQHAQLRERVYQALRVLKETCYPGEKGRWLPLCGICYLTFGSCLVHFRRQRDPHFDEHLTVCPACYKQLKADPTVELLPEEHEPSLMELASQGTGGQA